MQGRGCWMAARPISLLWGDEMNITVRKEDVSAIMDEISGIVNELEYLDDTDAIEDVWYCAERIKIQLFLLSGVIDAAASEKEVRT